MDTCYVFSDGACEGELDKEVSIGAVLISPCGIACEFFAEIIPRPWMEMFLTASQHPIFEIELLPVWISLTLWEGYLSNTQCVFYLDNEAAKGALIKGATDAGSGTRLVQAFVVSEMNLQIKVWFSRVPTSSNIADAPSRMSFEELSNVRRQRIDWDRLLKRLEEDGSKNWGFEERDPESTPTAVKKRRGPPMSVFALRHVHIRFSAFICRLHLWRRRNGMR